jgi:hypothetical protein
MKIEFDFRTDITVCELVQYLCDELEVQSRFTDNDIARCAEGVRTDMKTWSIEENLRRETKLINLIDDIQMFATFVDRESN